MLNFILQKIRLSIRAKLLTMIGGPLILIYMLVLSIEYHELRKTAYAYMESYLMELASDYAARLDISLTKFAQVAQQTASFLELHSDISEDQLYKLLRTNINQDPLIYGACIAFEPNSFDPKIKLLAPYVYRGHDQDRTLTSIDIGRDAYNYLKWDWYRLAKERNTAFWTEPYFDKNAGKTIESTYTVPFYKDGKFWGVATVDIRLADLQTHLGISEFKKEQFAIFTQEGKFISHPNPAAIMKETLFTWAQKNNIPAMKPLADQMVSGKKGAMLFPKFINGKNYFIAYAPIPSTRWIFSAAILEPEIMAPVWKKLTVFSTIMLSGLCIIFLILLITAIRITRPIQNLAQVVREISKGNLDIRAQCGFDRDEIGDLGCGINKMAGDLKDYIKALTLEVQARQAVESELNVARDIQTSLLPRIFPPYPERQEFDLHAVNYAARHVAGDFFDFTFVREDLLMFLIADVSGKGIPAALFMAVARTLIRNFASAGMAPSAVLEQTNKILAQENENGFFVTIFIGYFEIKTGRLVYANAGHLTPYLITKNGGIQPFGTQTGTILGTFEGETFRQIEATLNPGDALILYTDGFTEAKDQNGEFYGDEKFKRLLTSCSAYSAKDICEFAFKTVNEFQKQDLRDDITILALRRY